MTKLNDPLERGYVRMQHNESGGVADFPEESVETWEENGWERVELPKPEVQANIQEAQAAVISHGKKTKE